MIIFFIIPEIYLLEMNLFAIKDLCTRVYKKLLELNFYAKSTDDQQTTVKGRLATRLYILIFIFSIIILTFYSSLRYSTETVTINNPTLIDYFRFQKSVDERITCPCTNIALSQSLFISFTPEYHQLCSSDFLSTNWFDYLIFVQDTSLYGVSSWHWGILPKFRFLEAMCQLAENTVQDAIDRFAQSKFVSSVVLISDEFNSQTSVIIDTLVQSIVLCSL